MLMTKGDFSRAFWKQLRSIPRTEDRIRAYIDHMLPGGTIAASMLVSSAIHCDSKLHPTSQHEFHEGMQALCKIIRQMKKDGDDIKGPQSPSQVDRQVTKG